MTRTNIPMFTGEAEANAWHRPLPADHLILSGEAGYWAAAGEVAAAVVAQYCADIDADDTDAMDAALKAVNDAANNTWNEGLSHDEWVSAALARLR